MSKSKLQSKSPHRAVAGHVKADCAGCVWSGLSVLVDQRQRWGSLLGGSNNNRVQTGHGLRFAGTDYDVGAFRIDAPMSPGRNTTPVRQRHHLSKSRDYM